MYLRIEGQMVEENGADDVSVRITVYRCAPVRRLVGCRLNYSIEIVVEKDKKGLGERVLHGLRRNYNQLKGISRPLHFPKGKGRGNGLY